MAFFLYESEQRVAQQGEVADEIGIAAAGGIFAPDGILAPVVAVFYSAPVSPDEVVPLVPGALCGSKAADVVANRFGFLAVAQALQPDGDDASGMGEAALHGAGRQDGDGALFDAPVLFDSFSVAGPGSGEGFLDVAEQVALVPFDLLDYSTGGFVLVVQRICGDGFPVERVLFPDQALGGFEFAVRAAAFFFEQ